MEENDINSNDDGDDQENVTGNSMLNVEKENKISISNNTKENSPLDKQSQSVKEENIDIENDGHSLKKIEQAQSENRKIEDYEVVTANLKSKSGQITYNHQIQHELPNTEIIQRIEEDNSQQLGSKIKAHSEKAELNISQSSLVYKKTISEPLDLDIESIKLSNQKEESDLAHEQAIEDNNNDTQEVEKEEIQVIQQTSKQDNDENEGLTPEVTSKNQE